MKKWILAAIVCVLTFGWTCLPALAETKGTGNAYGVTDANEKAPKKDKKEKKEKKEKKHEGKKKGHEKKIEDGNSVGKKS